MTSKLTREERVQALYDLKVGQVLGLADIENVKMLSRMALAAMDGEPVAWREPFTGSCVSSIFYQDGSSPLDHGYEPLYRHAQPAPERDQVRQEHAEWSQATFGNVGPVGPLKHLSKEALEAAAEPDDLSEWADMQFLMWDAQRRAGITDEQITQAMIDKLAVNKQREWPEPKDGEPRLHIKEQPALTGNSPVIPDGSEHCPCCGKKLRRACSVEGCGGKHVAHGLCQKHYDMKRWEDPEQVERFREAGRRYQGKKKSTEATPQEVKSES